MAHISSKFQRSGLVSWLALVCATGCDTFARQPENSAVMLPPRLSASVAAGAITATVLTAAVPASSVPPSAAATAPVACLPDNSSPVFAAFTVDSEALLDAQRTLYSWTTEQQAQELKAGGPLLSRSERPGMGAGNAVNHLSTLSQGTGTTAQLVKSLLAPGFERMRYAWPNPWATRMGWPAEAGDEAETYGGHLVRIVLKPDSWIVVVYNEDAHVADFLGQQVAVEDAIAHPERIAGVFYTNISEVVTGSGSFRRSTASYYREFVVMNPDAVESFGVDDPDSVKRLQADVARLAELLKRVGDCGEVHIELPSTEADAFYRALSFVNSYYQPESVPLAQLIAILTADYVAFSQSSVESAEAGATVSEFDASAASDAGSAFSDAASTLTASAPPSASAAPSEAGIDVGAEASVLDSGNGPPAPAATGPDAAAVDAH